jgi:hypothetical protein
MTGELLQEVYDRITEECFALFDEEEKMTVDEVLIRLMSLEGVVMHSPYHHYILPAALLVCAAMDKKPTREEFHKQLQAAEGRGKTVPGGACGNCGACGSGIGIGIFISIFTGATPLSTESWKLANEGTAKGLLGLAEYPGPRCCKRTAFLALRSAVPYINEKCGLDIGLNKEITCDFYDRNAECLGLDCPFYKEMN